ncbi:MAG TPA: hypothetical protein VFP56_07080 [Candidatus Limnocylindrales bacterium]|nr:hypothetical protein [Candidatus Limnocylindrales bacterium]
MTRGTTGRGVVLALVIAVSAGCGTPVALRTAPAAVDACDQALIGGVLVPSSQSGLAVQPTARNQEMVEVLWPFGYSAVRDLEGAMTLRDASGKEIAREGETILMGGGLGANGVWAACAGTVESAPGI